MMKNSGMLILTNPTKFVRYVPRLQKEVQNILYVQILTQSPVKLPIATTIGRYPSPCYSNSVKNIYSKSILAKPLDVRILLSGFKSNTADKIITKTPIEVVFFDNNLKKDDMDQFVCRFIENRTVDCSVVSLEDDNEEIDSNDFECTDKSVYDNVVLGGTFDRLHCGHKALLSDAILRCNRHLTIGITGPGMLKSKKLWELIEPCQERMDKVRDFVCDVEPNIQYSFVQIDDVYGPTKNDPTFEALVVSVETLRGSALINEERKRNGIAPLAVYSVGLLPDLPRDDVEEDKVSSSNDRLRLLGTKIRKPKERDDLPKWPYIVGLTGGICAGKTAIAADLSDLGATVINCDQIAHQVYRKGEEVYHEIVKKFGEEILGEDLEINRKKLGSIVFADKEALSALNWLVWPGVMERLESEVQDVRIAGGRVVVVEAALMLQAGWATRFHEIWVSIVPPDEAIRRMLEDRGVSSHEDAMARLASQPSNSDYVAAANVVFSSAWSREFTKRQVHRAWETLCKQLKTR